MAKNESWNENPLLLGQLLFFWHVLLMCLGMSWQHPGNCVGIFLCLFQPRLLTGSMGFWDMRTRSLKKLLGDSVGRKVCLLHIVLWNKIDNLKSPALLWTGVRHQKKGVVIFCVKRKRSMGNNGCATWVCRKKQCLSLLWKAQQGKDKSGPAF